MPDIHVAHTHTFTHSQMSTHNINVNTPPCVCGGQQEQCCEVETSGLLGMFVMSKDVLLRHTGERTFS